MRTGLRLIVFLAGCGLLALWVYPQIDVTYSSWSNQENSWRPFKTIYRRAFLTNVDFGTEPNISIARDETLWPMLRSKSLVLPGYPVQRQVRIRWLTQFVQSTLIVVVASGLLWAVKTK